MKKNSDSISQSEVYHPKSIHKVVFNQKLYLGFAIAGANVMNMLVAGALMKYYTDIVHMSPQLYGLVYLFYSIWNAINDPLFGYLSDRRPVQSGVGKRLPWMRRTIPLFILGFYLLWLGNPSWDQIVTFLYLLGSLFIFDSAFTIYVLNHCALSTGITDNPNERASISMIITYFNIIPGVIGFIPPFFLTGGFSQSQIIPIFSVIGIIGTILMIFGTIKIKEPEILFEEEKTIALKTALKHTFKSKSFIFFVIYSAMMGGVAISFASIILYYLHWVAGLSQLMAIIPVVIGGIFILAFYPLVYKLNKKMGVRNTLLININIGIIGFVGLLMTPEGVLWLVIVFYSCVLFSNGIHWMLLNTIIGDIADEDELKTGKRREGMFFGINALIATPSVSLLILFFTIILENTNYDYSEGVVSQPVEAILGIRLGVGILPVIFLIIGLIMMYFYPLHGKKYMELKNKIQILYEKKLSDKEISNIHKNVNNS